MRDALAFTRRVIVQGAGAALGAAALPSALAQPMVALVPPAAAAAPAFDAAGFVVDLRAAGFRVGMVRAATRDPEAPGWPSYFIRRPAGGAGLGWGNLPDRCREAMVADPDYRDRVANLLEAECAAADAGVSA